MTGGPLRELPEGVRVDGPSRLVPHESVRFFYDLTWRDERGHTILQQQIYDRVFEIVDRAQRFLVLDLFLYNDFAGEVLDGFRHLADELTERLVARAEGLGSNLLLITDPINEHYGGSNSRHLDRLRAAGIDVVITRLDRLPDPNPIYSTFWRALVQWWGNSSTGGWLQSPLDPGRQVTLRTYLRMFNFKANHRKVVVADDGEQPICLVTSANPHDASSRHSNVALEVRGAPAIDLLDSELAIARFSGWRGELSVPEPVVTRGGSDGDGLVVRILTESAVQDATLGRLAEVAEGDTVDVAMFYLSDRDVVEALFAASERGARVRLLLDANRDAFGRQKDGIPNRPVAHELRRRSDGRIEVRWYRTEGEQFHTKLTLIRRGGRLAAALGSSNLTRRNIEDFNLEADVEVEMDLDSDLGFELAEYFERLWTNHDGCFSQPYEVWEDRSRTKYWRYRVMEATGLSAF